MDYTPILIVFGLVSFLGGTIFYNAIRRKMAPAIGVGGSYIFLLGVVGLAGGIGGVLKGEDNIVSLVMFFLIGAAGIGYTVYVMIKKCSSIAQRIALPFAAYCIACGFFWRLLLKIFFHIEMESGSYEPQRSFNVPSSLQSSDGKVRVRSSSAENTVVLTSGGMEAEFEFMDLIEYGGASYVVLYPVEKRGNEALILQVDESGNGDEEIYLEVNDDRIVKAVFKIFKKRYKRG